MGRGLDDALPKCTCAACRPAGPVTPRQAPITQSADCSFQVGTPAKAPAAARCRDRQHPHPAGFELGEHARGGDGADIGGSGDDVGDASSAVSKTRMAGALTSPPACRVSCASAMWLGLPSAVESATVTAAASAQDGEQIAAGFQLRIGPDRENDVFGHQRRDRRVFAVLEIRDADQLVADEIGRTDRQHVRVAGCLSTQWSRRGARRRPAC